MLYMYLERYTYKNPTHFPPILRGTVVEVQPNVLIHLNQMLLAGDAEEARRAVLVDVLRAQAVDRIG